MDVIVANLFKQQGGDIKYGWYANPIYYRTSSLSLGYITPSLFPKTILIWSETLSVVVILRSVIYFLFDHTHSEFCMLFKFWYICTISICLLIMHCTSFGNQYFNFVSMAKYTKHQDISNRIVWCNQKSANLCKYWLIITKIKLFAIHFIVSSYFCPCSSCMQFVFGNEPLFAPSTWKKREIALKFISIQCIVRVQIRGIRVCISRRDWGRYQDANLSTPASLKSTHSTDWWRSRDSSE